jgi:two-component system KDP operon response regulator KdpE
MNTAYNVQPALAHEGYFVEHTLPGRNALRQILLREPDLVILGINIHNGEWRFCRQLLTFLESPLLLLLTGADKLDRVHGLDMGADSCIFKPVHIPELLAQVRALLRQNPPGRSRQEQSYLVDDDLEVDLARREVRLNGEPIALTATEFRVLACLVRHRGQVISHDRLQSEVWGRARTNRQSSLKQYIHHLRTKIEPDPSHPQRIITRRGEGYMLRSSDNSNQTAH